MTIKMEGIEKYELHFVLFGFYLFILKSIEAAPLTLSSALPPHSMLLPMKGITSKVKL